MHKKPDDLEVNVNAQSNLLREAGFRENSRLPETARFNTSLYVTDRNSLSVIACANASKANQSINPTDQSNQSAIHIINHPPDQSINHSFIYSLNRSIHQ